MSLQFLLGTGSMDHQTSFIQDAKDWLQQDPANEVYFLVPNYNKFELEKDILDALCATDEVFSTIRSQVFSFRRLAWYFLQKRADFQTTTLTESSAAMIFRKVLLDHYEELSVFRGEVNKTGFIQQLFTLYNELREGNITAEDLAFSINQSQGDQNLKLRDLATIFSYFDEALAQRQLRSNDYLEQLKEHMATSDLSKVLFIVTGFPRFSAREIQLLGVLMQQGHLEVSLLLDQPVLNQELDPLDLFFENKTSYQKLYQMAKATDCQVWVDRYAQPQKIAPELLALQNYWVQSQTQQPIQATTLGKNVCLQLMKAENPSEEINWIARKIRRKVSEGGFRYKDIQLLVRDMDTYTALISSTFKQHEIPFYLDQDSAMEQHPLVEFLNALFAINRYDYRISDIMRLLRTELFLPKTEGVNWEQARDSFRDKVDITENIALAYNFQGYFWRQEKDWSLYLYDFENEEATDVTEEQEITNEVRRFVQKNLIPFFEAVEKAKDGQAIARLIYELLMDVGVEEQILAWRDQEINRGQLEAARNHEQTWNALMALLDEYVLIYGEDDVDWQVFQDIIQTGMKNSTYGMIPTALDQVRINRLELARPDQAKITFAIGLNDQVFPARIESTGLLSAEDKAFVNQQLDEGKYLIEDSTSLNREPFYAYLVFLSATQQLYLSYAANYDTQKDIKISPYLQRIQQQLQLPMIIVESLSLESNSLERLGTYRALLGSLNLIYRQVNDEKLLLPKSWQYFEKLLKNSNQKALTERTLSSLEHLNVPAPLAPEVVTALYGKDLYASVSRLESFYNCEYKYFATYGLRLRERQIYGLTPAATGDFYHEVLDRFITAVIANQVHLVDMSAKERETLTEAVLLEVFGEARFQILDSSARMNYIRYQLKQTIEKVSWALQEQSRRTGLSPVQTEVIFGQIASQKGLPGLALSLKNGGQLHVRGKIDRIDVAQSDGEAWLGVVDYKSSARSFDVTDAYYGLAMQLLTYLDIALSNVVELTGQQAAHPAGAYYLQVQNPVLTTDKQVEKETLKKFKYDGLFIDEPTVFEQLDHSLDAKDNSLLFPIRKDAKDNYQKIGVSKDKFYREDELLLLRDHNRKNMQRAGDKIFSGEIDLNPAYKDKQRVACQFCPFRSVCDFDVMLKENTYHRLDKLNKAKVIERLGGGTDEEHSTKASK